MKLRQFFVAPCLFLSALGFAPMANAESVAEQTIIVGDTTHLYQTTLTVSSAGQHLVSLQNLDFPQNSHFTKLQLLIKQGVNEIIKLNAMTGGLENASANINLSIGDYELLVYAKPDGAESVATYLATLHQGTTVADPLVFQSTQTVGGSKTNVVGANGKTTFKYEIDVPAAGMFNLNVTDQGNLTPLFGKFDALQVAVTSGSSVISISTSSSSYPLALNFPAAGKYFVSVYGDPGFSAAAGAVISQFGIIISNGTDTLLEKVQAVTDLQDPAATDVVTARLSLPIAMDGSYKLKVRDLNYPAMIDELSAVLVTNAAQTGTAVATDGNSVDVGALTVGEYTLFLAGKPQSNSGVVGIQLLNASDVVVAEFAVQLGNELLGGERLAINNAVQHDAKIWDALYGAGFSQLEFALLRADGFKQTVDTTGASPNLDAGTYFIFIQAKSSSSGIFGITIKETSDTVAPYLYQTVLAVSQVFSIAQSFSFGEDVIVSAAVKDFAFPSAFSVLDVVVVQGENTVGRFIGSASTDLSLTPGNYFVVAVANIAATAELGVAGYSFASTKKPEEQTETGGAGAGGDSSSGGGGGGSMPLYLIFLLLWPVVGVNRFSIRMPSRVADYWNDHG